jgi:phosphonate transport system substrate-binding protein
MSRKKRKNILFTTERRELSVPIRAKDGQAGPVRIRAGWSKVAACLVLIFACGVPLMPCSAMNQPEESLRIGFTSSMFTDVDENDARAAIKVWGAMIAKQTNTPATPVPVILKDAETLLQSLRKKQVDAVGITLTEYAQLLRDIHFDPIFVTYKDGSMTEQFVLLAHRKGPVKTLADLGGRSLSVHVNSRAYLAPLWLDTLLIKQGHTAAARFAARIVPNAKLSNVILPVFFRKSDVCLVTRSGFDTMVELNPQLGQQLVVLAESPPVVPAVFAFRADYRPSFREKLIADLTSLKKTAAGRQVLTIFQSEDIKEQSKDCLDTTLALIATHAKLVR